MKGSVNIQNILTADDKCQHELLVSQPTQIIKHLDLFSGIGGFAFAARSVWEKRYRTIAFCEIDKFAQKVLRKNFGNEIPIIDDIHNLRGNEFGTVDLITGGFPCQPFSIAGRRAGTDDERFLWGEMLRVIRASKARWVVGENVSGFVNMAYDQVSASLEDCGYEVESFIIPASAINAPHQRERIWIIAHAKFSGLEKLPERWGKIKRILQETSDTFTTHSTIKRINRCGNRNINRGDYGVSSGLDRNNRLKALGNAIVPQVAMVILAAIKAVDDAQSQTLQMRSG